MSVNPRKSASAWVDPDDGPEWSDAMLSRAELAEGEKILRPATGTLRGRGRPRVASPKRKSPFDSIKMYSPVSRAPAQVGRTE